MHSKKAILDHFEGSKITISNYNSFLYLKIVSLFKLVSVAAETGLNLSLSETFIR